MPYSESDRVIDELLVVHVLSGDQKAVDRLGARWHARLLSVARHITGDEEMAKEAAQEAWVGICRGWTRLSEPARFSPWALGILRKKCIDGVRAKARTRLRSQPLGGVDAAAPAQGSDRAALGEAFAALSPEHRAAASLFFLEGLTVREIAAATGLPFGTVQSRIFHARRRLKAHLSGDEDGGTRGQAEKVARSG